MYDMSDPFAWDYLVLIFVVLFLAAERSPSSTATENAVRSSWNWMVNHLILMLGLQHLLFENCFHLQTHIPAGPFSDLLSKCVFSHSLATHWAVSLPSLFALTPKQREMLDVFQWFVVCVVTVACLAFIMQGSSRQWCHHRVSLAHESSPRICG